MALKVSLVELLFCFILETLMLDSSFTNPIVFSFRAFQVFVVWEQS